MARGANQPPSKEHDKNAPFKEHDKNAPSKEHDKNGLTHCKKRANALRQFRNGCPDCRGMIQGGQHKT